MNRVSERHRAPLDSAPAQAESSRDVLTLNLGAEHHLRAEVSAVIERTLDQLNQHASRATFFVGERTINTREADVRAIAEEGHEIGFLLCGKSVARWNLDAIRAARESLQQITGQAVTGFRDELFSLDKGDLARWSTVARAGFRYDSSVLPYESTADSQLSLPRYPFRLILDAENLIVWPITTARFFGRLFPLACDPYTRAMPYWLLRRSLQTFHGAGWPVVVALSLETPSSGSGEGQRTQDRLKLLGRLLEDFQFDTLDAATRRQNAAELTTLRLKSGTAPKLKHRPCVTEQDKR